jgi:hypothetical protein
MARSKLEVLTEPVIADLMNGQLVHPESFQSSVGDLLHLLWTGVAPPSLTELAQQRPVRGLKKHLRLLCRYMETESPLPKALCAHYKFEMPIKMALRRYGVRKTDWKLVHDLAFAYGLDTDLYIRGTAVYAKGVGAWYDDLERELITVQVSLEKSALDEILVTCLEGYLSPRIGHKKGYEVYGLTLGMTRSVTQINPRSGRTEGYFVHVMRSQPMLSAEGRPNEVIPRDKSRDAILQATRTLYPHFEVIGDWHSHTYDSLAQMIRARGWFPSKIDEQFNKHWVEELTELGHRPMVAFIVALAHSEKRVAMSHFRGEPNTLQVSINGCRIVIAVHRILMSKRYYSENIRLRVPGVME